MQARLPGGSRVLWILRAAPPMRLALAATFLALLAAPSARALVVQSYDSTINERFASGFPSGPVANQDPDFLLAGYDLSGVGWRDNNSAFSVTLISPEHFLTAAHVAPAAGSTVSFLGADGVKRTYTVSTVTTLSYDGRASDLSLGRLTEVVDTAHISFYNGLYLGNTAADYQGLPVVLYGANGRVGANTVETVGAYDMLPFNGGDGLVDSVVSLTDYDPVTGEAQGQGGDSGSPTFVRVLGDQLALFGIHSAVGTDSNNVQYTFDTLPVFTAYGQIDAALKAAGYADGWLVYTGGGLVTAVPEPAAAARLTALPAALLALARRRRRA